MTKLFFLATTLLASGLYFFLPNQAKKAHVALENLELKTKSAEAKLTFGSLTTQEVVDLSIAFKATLTTAQIATTQLDYTLANAVKWSNFPAFFVPRLGLRFGDMSAAQLAAAKAIIKAATGTSANEGYQELEQIWAADTYANQSGFGATEYYIAFLGLPSMTGTWELQTGGHHLVVSNTYKNGVLVGATPSFRGVEPIGAFQVGTNTYEPMRQDRDALSAIFTGLNATQATTAKLSATFSDILLGPGKDWQFPTTRLGLPCSSLDAAQKALVMAAIRTYVEDIDSANAKIILAKYTADLDQTYIAYSGSATLAVANAYVRIDGPNIWLEYSVQGSTAHPHSVWRDRKSDYGGTGNPTAVSETANVIESIGNYPNPVTHDTSIQINLSNTAKVAVSIYDLSGKLITTVFQGNLSAGRHTIPLNVSNLAKGSYIYKVEANEKGAIKMLSKQMIKI